MRNTGTRRGFVKRSDAIHVSNYPPGVRPILRLTSTIAFDYRLSQVSSDIQKITR